MILQGTVMDQSLIEAVFRSVQNSQTATATITARTVAVNTPVVLETSTASLPTTTANSSRPYYPNTNGQNFAFRPATSTSLANNLLLGLLKSAPRTDYLEAEAFGLVQCYGAFLGAIINRSTAGNIVAGGVLVPESLQFLIAGSGPVTAAATATAGHVEAPAIGGLIYSMSAIASSSATETTTGPVFIRCM